MPSHIIRQPDGKYAVFSDVADDFTSFGLTHAEALVWGERKWGERIASQKFASAVSDEPIGTNTTLSIDGLGRWRFSLCGISAAYGLKYLLTTLSEIGFANAEIPQSAIDGATGNPLDADASNVVQLGTTRAKSANFDRSKLSAYLLKLSMGLRDDKPHR